MTTENYTEPFVYGKTNNSRTPDRTKFGGYIYSSDYDIIDDRSNAEHSESYLAGRIAHDQRFDNLCRKAANWRKERYGY